MRLVAGDGVGDLVERVEAVGLLAHERLDLVDALRLDARSDVDEHQGGGVDVVLADGHQARPAAHRRADEHRAAVAERRDHGDQVVDHRVLAVDAVRRPVGVAVAPGVEGDGVVAGRAQRLRRRPSRRDGSGRRRAAG